MSVFWAAVGAACASASLLLAGLWRLAHARAWLRPAERSGPPPPVAWALAGAIAGVAVLVVLTLARAWQGDGMAQLDRLAQAAAREAWSLRLASLVRALTDLADPIVLWAWAIGMGAALWWRGRRALALSWWAAIGGNAALNLTLKNSFERLRPQADLSGLSASGYSYPSGHTSGAVVCYGMLAYLAWRLLPSRWHLPACLAALWVVLGVGASRVYLQAHYLSDVLAGLASGGAWLSLCMAASGAWAARARGA